MRPSFRSVALAIAVSFFALALTLLLAPELLVARWGLDVTLPVAVVCRRAAALFAGIAVMFLLARNAEPSAGRSALSQGLVACCSMLAVLGGAELAVGHVTPGILAAIAIEIMLAVALLAVRRGPPDDLGSQDDMRRTT